MGSAPSCWRCSGDYTSNPQAWAASGAAVAVGRLASPNVERSTWPILCLPGRAGRRRLVPDLVIRARRGGAGGGGRPATVPVAGGPITDVGADEPPGQPAGPARGADPAAAGGLLPGLGGVD